MRFYFSAALLAMLLYFALLQTSFCQPVGSGYSLSFSGNSYVALNNSFSGVSLPVSVSAWIMPSTSGSAQRIFFSHNSNSAYYGVSFQVSGGNLTIAYGNGTSKSSAGRKSAHASVNLQANRWYHVAGVLYANNTASLYLNGNPLSVSYSGGASPPMATNNTSGFVGKTNSGTNYYLNAELDELTFWNKALTQQEIRDQMCRKLSGNEPGLLAYYRFDDGSGNTLSNHVTGGPDGTLMNGPGWVASSAPVGDRSFHNYYSNFGAIGFSLTGDSIVADAANTGIIGTQLYFVDALPSTTAGISIPAGVNYYFGVFNAAYSKAYDVRVFPGPITGAATANSIKLAKRPHNAASPWNLTTPTNNPTITLLNQSPVSQFIIASDPCADFDFSLGNDTAVCRASGFKIGRPSGANETYLWNTGASTDSIVADTAGVYYLRVTKPGGCYEEDSIEVFNIAPLSNYLADDSTACDSLLLQVSGPLLNLSWMGGSTTGNKYRVTTSGLVWFTATDSLTGCSISDTINVNILNGNTLPSNSIDTVLCNQNSFAYDASVNGAISYQWYDGSTSPVRNFTSSGSYWFTRTFPGGCSNSDTLQLKFSQTTEPLAEDEFYICDDDTVKLALPANSYQAIIWSNGSNDPETAYWQPGDYWVETQNFDGCWHTDSFSVLLSPPMDSVQIFNDTSFCAGGGVLLSAPEGFKVKWPNGRGGNYFVGRSQDVRVEVSDGCTRSVEFFKVSEYSCECDVKFPNAFTPNGDGLNDLFGPATKCEFVSFRLEVYNRFGNLIFSSSSPQRLFDGSMDGKDLPLGVYTFVFTYSTPEKSGNTRGYFSLLR